MSPLKWFFILIILVAIGGGLWYTGTLERFGIRLTPMATAPVATTTPETPAPQTPPNDLPTAQNDASDAALIQDTAAIDTQLTGLGGDSASVSQSLNDKPIAQ